jgi:hypothetical protein
VRLAGTDSDTNTNKSTNTKDTKDTKAILLEDSTLSLHTLYFPKRLRVLVPFSSKFMLFEKMKRDEALW